MTTNASRFAKFLQLSTGQKSLGLSTFQCCFSAKVQICCTEQLNFQLRCTMEGVWLCCSHSFLVCTSMPVCGGMQIFESLRYRRYPKAYLYEIIWHSRMPNNEARLLLIALKFPQNSSLTWQQTQNTESKWHIGMLQTWTSWGLCHIMWPLYVP